MEILQRNTNKLIAKATAKTHIIILMIDEIHCMSNIFCNKQFGKYPLKEKQPHCIASACEWLPWTFDA